PAALRVAVGGSATVGSALRVARSGAEVRPPFGSRWLCCMTGTPARNALMLAASEANSLRVGVCPTNTAAFDDEVTVAKPLSCASAAVVTKAAWPSQTATSAAKTTNGAELIRALISAMRRPPTAGSHTPLVALLTRRDVTLRWVQVRGLKVCGSWHERLARI